MKTKIETGVLFGDIHSFRDLNLVLAPFVLSPAKPKTNYIDIPGADGSIDATEATGEVKYNDREFTFTFTVFPQDALTFEERQTVVSNAINGKYFKITIEKDPDYYWLGRCVVNEYLSNKRLHQIVVNARVSPYKLKQHVTVITHKLTESGDLLYLVNNQRKTVTPEITTTEDGAYIKAGSVKYENIPAGTFKATDLQLVQGVEIWIVKGTGTMTITYQEGDL